MSDTKWRKLFGALVEAVASVPDHVVVKFVDVEEPKRMLFPFGLHPPRPFVDTAEFGPTALRVIEWLDVPGDIAGLLQPIGRIPIERQGPYTRVIGYAAKIPACS